MKGLPIRQILVVLLAIPALALSFFIYQTGNLYVGLGLLVVTCLGIYIYLNPSANTFRYLFPGFLGFGALRHLSARLHDTDWVHQVQLPEPPYL